MLRNPSHTVSRFAMLPFVFCLYAAPGQELPPEMAPAAPSPGSPKALRMNLRPVWRPENPTLEILTGDRPVAVRVEFPAVRSVANERLVMRFRLRMVTPTFGGWNHFLHIDVNGTALSAYAASGEPRLLNRRGRAMKTSSPKWPTEPYFKSVEGGKSALLTVFGPGWDTIEPRFTVDRQELYWFVLDITDAVRKSGTNTLTFTNIALARYFKKTPEQMRKMPMLIDKLEIGMVDDTIRDRLIENLTAGMKSFRVAARVSAGGVSLSASAGGALRIRWSGDDYYCRSTFSEAGKTIRFNRFWWTPTGDWEVTVRREGADALVVSGRTQSYDITRRASLDGRFVRIRDTVINRSGADLGIMLKHELIAGEIAAEWRLSGIRNAAVFSDTAANPTVHFRGKRTGLGAALLDTVMRAQMVESGGRRTLSFDNDHFGLAPGETYTLKWSIYVGGPDFWEFINAVREDWGANRATIPGMYCFWRPETPPHKTLMADPDKLRAYLRRKRIDIFSLSPWFEYYSPPKYWKPRSVYKKLVRDTIAKIRAVQPDAKFIANTETFLYYVPETFFRGTLPAYWTQAKGELPRGPKRPHDYSLSAAATAVIDATPWRDSVFRDEKGNAVIDLHYAGAYKDGGVNLKVFPTLNNYWFGKFNEMIDFLLEDCGMDGIYIDSFSYYHSRTYDRWDGHSVDIDPNTGTIKSKYSRLGLLTAPARRQWVKRITDRGKICYVNGKRSTEELQDTSQIGYMEAEWTFNPAVEPLSAARAAKAQLSAPLALGVRPQRYPEHKTQYAEVIHKAVIAYLRHGVLYCHYTSEIPPPDQPGGGEYGILNHMFPFTPVELHEGWLVGKERIITAVSGTFTWPGARKPDCRRFDLRGLQQEGGFEFERNAAGWQVTVSLNDWRETAVIQAPGE